MASQLNSFWSFKLRHKKKEIPAQRFKKKQRDREKERASQSQSFLFFFFLGQKRLWGRHDEIGMEQRKRERKRVKWFPFPRCVGNALFCLIEWDGPIIFSYSLFMTLEASSLRFSLFLSFFLCLFFWIFKKFNFIANLYMIKSTNLMNGY